MIPGIGPRVARRLAVAVVVFVGCGGGGGGGGGNPGPTPPTGSIVFTPSTAPASGAIVMVGSSPTSEVLLVDVVARTVSDLYGVACDVTYPAALRFVSASEGTVLSAAGSVATAFQVNENPTGRLVVGLTRLGAVDGLAAANGVLLSLRFEASASGSGAVSFLDPTAADDRGQTLGVEWAGGSVTVVR